MKNFVRISSYICLMALLNVSCEKDLGLVDPDVNTLEKGSYLKLLEAGNDKIDFADPANSVVSVTVQEIGAAVNKINVYTGESDDPSQWSLVKSFSGTGGENKLDVTGADIAAALGIPATDLAPGNSYTLYTEVVTTDGRAFNISNANADLVGQPPYASLFSYNAVVYCGYDPESTNDVTYEVVQDDWLDFAPGTPITVFNGPGTNQVTLKDVFATSFNHSDIVMDVDPVTGSVTIAQQDYGQYAEGDVTYSAEGSGFIFSCAGTIDITLTHSADGTPIGDFRFILRRQ